MRYFMGLMGGCFSWVMLWGSFYNHVHAVGVNWLAEKENTVLHGPRSYYSGRGLRRSRQPSLIEDGKQDQLTEMESEEVDLEEPKGEAGETQVKEEKKEEKKEKTKKKEKKEKGHKEHHHHAHGSHGHHHHHHHHHHR